MNIGYIRVSTVEQNEGRQVDMQLKIYIKIRHITIN